MHKRWRYSCTSLSTVWLPRNFMQRACIVDVNALKRADWTPLMLACTKPYLEIVKELLQHGASLDIVNKDGWTAFHIATREGHLDIVKFLLDSNHTVWNTTSKNGRTPLHTASLHGHLNVVELLVADAQYNINVKDSCGTTPLMDAAYGNHNHVLKYLISKGAIADEVDKLGKNVLHISAETGNLESIKYLIENSLIDINSQTTQGLTPLHFAYKENKVECVKLLLDLGSDTSISDRQNRTALEYSKKADVRLCV
ncbi:hypothetical protein JTE90_019268 [Oedothorax gibbosus]|uniref:Ankyrin repeat domain-containing protein 16 n=1 Tax=Oedothorax gibbosus TaxID=931172 RepID=A0AAV6UVL7_9ARAC|nr:hypothetical protein JTE90_019268 [Oedothorax gibbosus]